MNVLTNALIATLRSPLNKYSSMKVDDLGISKKMSYCVVSRSVGFAYAPEAEPPEEVHEPGEYVRTLFRGAWKGLLETSLALAAMSALTQLWIDDGGDVTFESVDILDLLDLKTGDNVIVIGYMENVIKKLVEAGIKVKLYEDNAHFRCQAKVLGVEALPGSYSLLEEGDAEAVIATGSSLLDPRGPHLLEKVRAKKKLLLGPSATVHPYFAKLLGATHVGGSYVKPENRKRVLNLIKMGYGYKRLVRMKLIEKWFAEAK